MPGYTIRIKKADPEVGFLRIQREAGITASFLRPERQPEQPGQQRQRPGQPERPGQQRQRPEQPEPEQRPGQQLQEPGPEPERLLLFCRKRTGQRPAGQQRGATVSFLDLPIQGSALDKNTSSTVGTMLQCG